MQYLPGPTFYDMPMIATIIKQKTHYTAKYLFTKEVTTKPKKKKNTYNLKKKQFQITDT